MADVIGIVAGLIGISQAGVATSKTLFSLGRSLVKAKEQINDLAQELSNISSAFESLAQVLESSDGLLKPALLDTTQAILDDCKRIFLEIEENVKVVETHALRARDRAQWPFRKAKVKQLKSRLESAKATLCLMVNILNLSTGIKFLQQQTQPPPAIIEETQGMFATSTDSVIEVQLAFDKAGEYEKQLVEGEGHKRLKTVKASASKSKRISTTLIKIRPIGDLALDLPGFVELAVIPLNKAANNYNGKGKTACEEGDNSIIRYQQIERQAPIIVKELCACWTNVDEVLGDKAYEIASLGQEDDRGVGLRDSGSVTDQVETDAGVTDSVGTTVPREQHETSWTAEVPFLPKRPGFTVRSGTGDEPQASVASYSSRLSSSANQNRIWQESTEADTLIQDNATASPEPSRHNSEAWDFDTIRVFSSLPPFEICFPAFAIEDGQVTIEDIRKEIAKRKIDKVQDGDSNQIKIWHNGLLLRNNNITARAMGLKHQSEVFAAYTDIANSIPEPETGRDRLREWIPASFAQSRDNQNRQSADRPRIFQKVETILNQDTTASDSEDDIRNPGGRYDILHVVPACQRYSYNTDPPGCMVTRFKHCSIRNGDLMMSDIFSRVKVITAGLGNRQIELYYRGARLGGRDDIVARSEGLYNGSYVFCRILNKSLRTPNFFPMETTWKVMCSRAKPLEFSYPVGFVTNADREPPYSLDLPDQSPAIVWLMIKEYLGDVYDGHLTRTMAELYLTTDVLPVLFPRSQVSRKEMASVEDLIEAHGILWVDLFRANQRVLDEELCASDSRQRPYQTCLSIVSHTTTRGPFVDSAKVQSIIGLIFIDIECVPDEKPRRFSSFRGG